MKSAIILLVFSVLSFGITNDEFIFKLDVVDEFPPFMATSETSCAPLDEYGRDEFKKNCNQLVREKYICHKEDQSYVIFKFEGLSDCQRALEYSLEHYN